MRCHGLLHVSQLSLRIDGFTFKTLDKLLITLEESNVYMTSSEKQKYPYQHLATLFMVCTVSILVV